MPRPRAVSVPRTRKELEQLTAALEHANRGLYAVSICGEAGVGKSRLVHEFRRTVLEQQVCWLQCSCSPTAQATPLSPVIDAMTNLAGLSPEDDNNQKLDRLEKLAATAVWTLAKRCPP